MAETFEYMNKTSIDPELICNICESPFNDPCCTSCDETFCRKCIMQWIQKGNSSCPHCRRSLSINNLRQVPRPLQNMLDRLPVKCLICRQTKLERGNFDDHIQKVCPKMVVTCPSADIKCPWTGHRDQLNQHLVDCRFEPIRPVMIQLIAENGELKDHVNQQTIEIIAQEDMMEQLLSMQKQLLSQIEG